MNIVHKSYVDHGEALRDTGIERGKMLVYSEDEWRDRARAESREGMPRKIRNLAVLYIIVLVLVMLITSQAEDPDADLISILAMIGVTIAFVFPTMLAWYQIQRSIDNGPVPGIYELGLQQSTIAYIPYSEIQTTEQKTYEPEGKTLLLMYPKYERKEGNRKPHRKPWAIKLEFLGEEGFKEIEARVKDVNAPGSPS